MLPRIAAAALAIAGCASNDDVVGPFTGTTYRYVLDGLQLPMTNREVTDLGGDLTRAGYPQNELGYELKLLSDEGDVNAHAADMFAGGIVMTTLEMIADDPSDDPTVGVELIGAPGATFEVVGGRLSDGWFRSNPTATSHVPGEAELVLPIFADADPSRIPLIGMELSLSPDGAGGLYASIHAAVPAGAYLAEAIAVGFTQMCAFDPGAHRTALQILDSWPYDRVITPGEIENNSLVGPAIAPDVTILGRKATSIGFGAHFRACPDGQCPPAPPFDACFDRVRDGDESDVDCGGSCRGCEQHGRCVTAADCRTATCELGQCGPPSCTDGMQNGFESDVDCGGNYVPRDAAGCAGCAVGQHCYFDGDCATGLDCKCTDENGNPCDSYKPRVGVCTAP